jgi:hypothetical protein
MRYLAAVAALAMLMITALLSGCGSGSGSAPSSPLQTNEALWKSRALSSYRYTLTTGAFSAQAGHPVTIEVHSGVTASITPVESNFTPDPAYFAQYATVEKLFDVIRNAQDAKANQLTASYDSHNGFPTQAFVDPNRQLADDEFSFQVSAFQPLP